MVFTQSSLPPNTTTTSKTKPYCFIKPYFHNKSLSSACLCLSLAPGPQITANRGRNSEMAAYREAAAHFLPPSLFLRHYRVYKNSRERQYRCDHHVVCCCFFSLLLPSHQSGFWNDVLLWITGGGRETRPHATVKNLLFPTDERKHSLKGNFGNLNLNPIFSHECSRKTISLKLVLYWWRAPKSFWGQFFCSEKYDQFKRQVLMLTNWSLRDT